MVDAGHALKNALRTGRQREIRYRSSEGQHCRMAGLNLLAAIIIYWNTAHLEEAVRPRKRVGLTVEPKLLARILLTGEYQWPKRRWRGLAYKISLCPKILAFAQKVGLCGSGTTTSPASG